MRVISAQRRGNPNEQTEARQYRQTRVQSISAKMADGKRGLTFGWKDGKRIRKSYFAKTREGVAMLLAEAQSRHDRGIRIALRV